MLVKVVTKAALRAAFVRQSRGRLCRTEQTESGIIAGKNKEFYLTPTLGRGLYLP